MKERDNSISAHIFNAFTHLADSYFKETNAIIIPLKSDSKTAFGALILKDWSVRSIGINYQKTDLMKKHLYCFSTVCTIIFFINF